MKKVASGSVFAAFALFASSVWGATIGSPTVKLETNFSPAVTGNVSASINGDVHGGYTFTATACFDLYCPGQAGVDNGSPYTVNDPLTLRLTNFTLTCNASSASPDPCGAIFINSTFKWTEINPAAVTLPVTVSIDGSAPAGTVLQLQSDQASCTQPDSNCDFVNLSTNGIVTVTADQNNAFAGIFHPGSLTLRGFSQSGKTGLSIQINSLAQGATISMPGSLNLTFGSPVPEPAALAILGLGVGALFAIRRRNQRVS